MKPIRTSQITITSIRAMLFALLLAFSAASAFAQAPATQAAPNATPACFGEAQWQALQASSAPAAGKQGSRALLYVWSPRMVYSVTHAHEVRQVAHALGLRFVPVHDGTLPPQEVKDALAVVTRRLPRGNKVRGSHPLTASVPLCAQSLVERDAYRHFPTAWVVQHGGFHPVPLVSAMPPRFWKMGLQQRMRQGNNMPVSPQPAASK